jgi:hypothetical protein
VNQIPRPIRIVLAALLPLLIFSPAAQAGVSNVANYKYRVTGFEYKASGELSAGHFNSACTPVDDSLWEGTVATTEADTELSSLRFGTGALEIGPHGTEGNFAAETMVYSKFSASYTETTGCAGDGTVASIGTTPCGQTSETKLSAFLNVQGKVGNRVKLTWEFSINHGDGLVPTTFGCVKPFKFVAVAPGDCSKAPTTVPLSKFTAKIVKLPFFCLATATKPPPGTNYTRFGSVVIGKGALVLKRVGKP